MLKIIRRVGNALEWAVCMTTLIMSWFATNICYFICNGIKVVTFQRQGFYRLLSPRAYLMLTGIIVEKSEDQIKEAILDEDEES